MHDLRDAYGADQVALVVAGFGGVAWGLHNLDPESQAVAFCWNGLLSSPFVMSHEIGHNMGCCHAIGDGGGCEGKGLLFEFSNGYRFFGDSGTQWHTIMAYSPGVQIQYFSNPDLVFDGQPMGIPDGLPQAADNVQTINISAFAVSNWRCNDGVCEALDLPSDAPDCNGNGIPDECDLALGSSSGLNANAILGDCGPCPWDCSDGDGNVNIVDFLTLLFQWGAPGTCDFDGGGVGITDMLALLGNWGPCF